MFTFTFLGSILLLAVTSIHAYAQAVPADTHTGDGTWYDPGQDDGVGACGWRNSSTQYVAAIGYQEFDSRLELEAGNPNTNAMCGKFIQVSYGGTFVVLQVVDRCQSCDGRYDVDMTNTAFKVFARETVGRLTGPGVTWHEVDSTTPLGPPLAPPASGRRSLDGRKRSPEHSGPAPPHDRRMIKRRAASAKSYTSGERGSIEPRDHLTKTDNHHVGHPVPRDVPLSRRAVEERDRKPPLQLPSIKRRMIKVARFSS